jgi:hypothetical protein
MENKSSIAYSTFTAVYLSAPFYYTERKRLQKNHMVRKYPHLPPALSLTLQFFSHCPAIHFTRIFDRVINFASDKSFGLVYIDKICMTENTTVGIQRKLRKPPFPLTTPPRFSSDGLIITRNTEYRAGYSNVMVMLAELVVSYAITMKAKAIKLFIQMDDITFFCSHT